jgi:predicted RNase H-like nuclease (RuvC/YqgF family)
MSMANEISSLESEMQSLRAENETLKHNKAIIDFENEGLRQALAKANIERDNFMRRSEALKALLDLTGNGLIAGLNKYHDAERELEARQRDADIDHAEIRAVITGHGMSVQAQRTRGDLSRQFEKMDRHA